MKSKEISYLRRHLINWYLINLRDLPWRRTHNAYHIWVSEVMLQQTQVNTVLPYYRKFLERFPDLDHLARADLQEVLKAWEGMGYYARARNLHRAAGVVRDRHNGLVPDSWDDFRKLPGVGDYIAAAVLSIAFGQPYPVVDGNVKRVLARLLVIDDPVNKAPAPNVFKLAAAELMAPRKPGTFNQAIMEVGATICRPQNPLCDQCPLQKICRAYQAAKVGQYPKKVKKRPTPKYHIAVGVVFKNGRVLITQRKLDGLLGGLWEFPGGKIRREETAAAACIREIKEEVNLNVGVDSFLTRVKHAYTHFSIIMEVFCCRYDSGKVKLNGPVDHRWIRLEDLDQFPLPKANHKFVPQLKKLGTCSSKTGIT